MKPILTAENLQRLEEKIAKDPKAYERHVMLLAFLGYGFVFGVAVFLFLFTLLIFYVIGHFYLFIFIKFLLIYFVFIWLILKSMWVKFPEPEGIILKQAQAPKLFELIEEVRLYAKSPIIQEVIINEEFNCGIVQYPKLGIFGFYKNILILGLPLLESLTQAEFKAVLAHEMGHLSSKHGIFSSFIYHVRITWEQIYHNLSQNKALVNLLILKFANWFVPYFDLHSLALIREQENAADQLSVKITDPEISAKALIKIVLLQNDFQLKLPKFIQDQITIHPKPPDDIAFAYRNIISIKHDTNEIVETIEENFKQHDLFDTHPALLERLKHILPNKNWSDLNCVVTELLDISQDSVKAVDLLQKDSIEELYKVMFFETYRKSLDSWEKQHLEFKEASLEISNLEEDLKRNDISQENACKLACLLVQTKANIESIVLIKQMLEIYPELAELYYWLGMLALENENDEGIAHLEKSIELKPFFASVAYQVIAEYLVFHNKTEEANIYYQRLEELNSEIIKTLAKVNGVNNNDIIYEHGLTEQEIVEVGSIFNLIPQIDKVYLLRKTVPAILGGYQFILIIKFTRPNWFNIYHDNILNKLGQILRMPAGYYFQLLSYTSFSQSLLKTRDFSDVLIYDKNLFKATPGLISADLTKNDLTKTLIHLFYKYKARIIAILFLLIFIWWGLNTKNNVNENQYVQSLDYGNYVKRVQAKIKLHWKPPKIDKALKTKVLFTLNNSGKVTQIKILQSSGNQKFDEAALSSVLDATPFDKLLSKTQKAIDIDFTFAYNQKNKAP